MSYTSNPHIGKTRRLAVNDVIYGRKTKAEAGRYYGVHRSTIGKWIKRASTDPKKYINTESSKPKRHPKQISIELETLIINLRKKIGRCAPILRAILDGRGIKVSESNITRRLKRNKLTRKRKWKPRYARVRRPEVEDLGDMVEMDTIHYVKSNGERFYIYTVIDLYSRIGYASYSKKLSMMDSLEVLNSYRLEYGMDIKMVQTDN